MIDPYIKDWIIIIKNMTTTTTYKIVWGKAILEIVYENPRLQTIHFDEISEKILKYYWNQTYFFNLKQGSTKSVEIIDITKKAIVHYQRQVKDNYPVWFDKAYKVLAKDEQFYNGIIKEISNVLTKDVSYRFPYVRGKTLDIYHLNKKDRTITFKNENILLLHEYSLLLAQLLNFKWAIILETYNTSPKIASKVKHISDNKIKRNALTKYRKILLETHEARPIDFYTGEILQDNDISVDHVIPWSFIYSDDIWNLVLTSRSNNSKKSNSRPTKEMIRKLNARNKKILDKLPHKEHVEMKEAIKYNYVDTFYQNLKFN